MNDIEQIKNKIKEVLIDSLELEADPEDIEDEQLLFNELGMDSIATLVLVEALEDEFDIEVMDEDLTVELLESVNSLAEYMVQKISLQSIHSINNSASVENSTES